MTEVLFSNWSAVVMSTGLVAADLAVDGGDPRAHPAAEVDRGAHRHGGAAVQAGAVGIVGVGEGAGGREVGAAVVGGDAAAERHELVDRVEPADVVLVVVRDHHVVEADHDAGGDQVVDASCRRLRRPI